MTFFGAYEPAGLMYLAMGIAKGDLKWNEELSKVLYACTLCGYCEDLCQRGYRHTPATSIIEDLRKAVPDKLKPKGIKSASDTLKITRNQKLKLLKEYGIIDLSEGGKSDILFFADDTLMSNSAKLKEIGFILEQSGKKIGCFCSNPLPPVSAALINGGCESELADAMDSIDEKISECGIKTVYVYNPETLSVLKRFSRSGAEFVSITNLYRDTIKKKKAKKLKLPAVTYQDPCHLGRYAKEYTAPREVIKLLGLELKEMWRTGHNSLCCGAGGGVIGSNPTLAKKYAGNRWKEAKATGAKVVVTACPFCYANLQGSKPKDVKVVDITTLAAQALGYTGKEGR